MDFVENLFKGRINRRNLLYGRVASIIVFFLLVTVGYFIFNSSETLLTIVLAILYIMLLTFNIALSARRLHDLNYSGWWALLQLVPLINIIFVLYLFFKEGEQRANKYGPKPSEKIFFPKDILGRK